MILPILALPVEQRRETFNQVSIEQNIPVQAVEKDWWVSVGLLTRSISCIGSG